LFETITSMGFSLRPTSAIRSPEERPGELVELRPRGRPQFDVRLQASDTNRERHAKQQSNV